MKELVFLSLILLLNSSCSKTKNTNTSTPNNHQIVYGPNLSDDFNIIKVLNQDISEMSVKSADSILKEVYDLDQKFRDASVKLRRLKVKNRIKRHDIALKMSKADSINYIILKRIIFNCGWPSQKLYSQKAMNGAFYTIIHSKGIDKDIDTLLDLIEEAFIQNEINSEYYAILKDELMLRKNGVQEFGTHCYTKNDKKYNYGIHNILKVQANRKKIGLAPLNKKSCELTMYR